LPVPSNTIVGEIPVGDRPTGPAVGKGSVWVGNHDDNTLLRIDPKSLDVMRVIGLGVAPIDVEVGTGSVWVLSDQVLLRVDPAINDVVATVPLPQPLARAGGRVLRSARMPSSSAAAGLLAASSASTLQRRPS
jgi:streptogramin lyase